MSIRMLLLSSQTPLQVSGFLLQSEMQGSQQSQQRGLEVSTMPSDHPKESNLSDVGALGRSLQSTLYSVAFSRTAHKTFSLSLGQFTT